MGDPSEQQRNKRDNHIIRVDGRAQCVTAWAEDYGRSHCRAYFQRLAITDVLSP